MISLICPIHTINIGVSFLSFCCCDSVCPWCIFTGIASDFICDSFSDRIRAAMPCFPGTTLARLIAISCIRLDSCSILFCLSPKDLHTSASWLVYRNYLKHAFHLYISQTHCWKTPHVVLRLPLMALAHPGNILSFQTLLMR